MTTKSRTGSLALADKMNLTEMIKEVGTRINSFELAEKISRQVSIVQDGKAQLQKRQEELSNKHQKLEFIKMMDSVWSKNGNDPDGFNYCVPPVSHVEYWSKHAVITHDWGRSPRYTEKEQTDVQKYYEWKKELGLPADEPRRHDIANFVSGMAKVLSIESKTLIQDLQISFKSILDDLKNALGEGVLKTVKSNIDDWQHLNQSIDQGIQLVDQEIKRLHEVQQKLANHTLLEIKAFDTKDSFSSLKNLDTINVTISFMVLDTPHQAEFTLEMNDIEGSLTSQLKSYLPVQLSDV